MGGKISGELMGGEKIILKGESIGKDFCSLGGVG